MSFEPEMQAKIDAYAAAMTVAHEPDAQLLIVAGYPHGGWAVFCYADGQLESFLVSATIRYQRVITGVEPEPWQAVNAGWERARAALADLSKIPTSYVIPERSRINTEVARYLAMKDRIDQWGGFTGEAETLPQLYAELSTPNKETVDARLRGEIVT